MKIVVVIGTVVVAVVVAVVVVYIVVVVVVVVSVLEICNCFINSVKEESTNKDIHLLF